MTGIKKNGPQAAFGLHAMKEDHRLGVIVTKPELMPLDKPYGDGDHLPRLDSGEGVYSPRNASIVTAERALARRHQGGRLILS